jgi:hypothetical protein
MKVLNMDKTEEQIRRIKDKIDCLNYQLTPELKPENFDVQRFVADMKVNKALVESGHKTLELVYNKPGVHDPVDDKELEIDMFEKLTEVEVLSQIISAIEAGKYFRKSD